MDVLTTRTLVRVSVNCLYILLDAPRYSEELKQLLAEQVFGTKLLVSDGTTFDMELAFKIACKVSVCYTETNN